jgi:hypothetical protein
MIKKRGGKPKVVIDTNILISSTNASTGKPNQVIKAWKEGLFFLVTSDQILEELQDVAKREGLRNKYRLFPERIHGLSESLKMGADRIIPLSEQSLPISSRDAKDNKLLACALGGEADYLVTGDRDLLDLNSNPKIGNLKIVSPSDFLKILQI